ncbi:mannose-6-phosphate isomerase, class I [Skermania piniformis]|uniref:mannose-6-phosphate isomerase n=1 Tax=Skermania pinensis TaxID=39122 RepID=A0ABX8S5Z2_9ACTN|nr:mannose-6-phosphate isomerase, class I [Skermania piniformis]QXQ13269.1 mannose-6-phosphate isomerase, class I [Skermania piniformis]
MHRLEGALRHYAWGSRTALAGLCGRPVPSAHPEAELWFGAHPADPAELIGPDGRRSLLTAISQDPDHELGAAVADRFDDRLPFLLKVLAAAEPLSLQAHPSAAQAFAGFARENRLGVALGSPERNYRDASHKPELVVALEPFDALAGFREPTRTLELLRALDVAELSIYADLLAGQPDASGLRAVFTTWITLPSGALARLVPQVVAGGERYLSRAGGEFEAEIQTVCQLADAYPDDAGVLAALLLNRVCLAPGEGLYLGAGNLHAYLHGLGVEIMANSDNVLRGGLTPKHMDVPELLRVLDFQPLPAPIRVGTDQLADGAVRYRTPAVEFALSRVDVPAAASAVGMPAPGPAIVLCTAGSVELSSGADRLVCTPGQAAWIAAGDPAVTARAGAAGSQVFCAAVGDPAATR